MPLQASLVLEVRRTAYASAINVQSEMEEMRLRRPLARSQASRNKVAGRINPVQAAISLHVHYVQVPAEIGVRITS